MSTNENIHTYMGMSFGSRIIRNSFIIKKTIARYKNILSNVIFECNTKQYASNWQFKSLPVPEKSPKIMQIEDTSNFRACLTKEVLILKNLFAENGYEIKIVGGAVRDLLLGSKPEDIDFATTATPSEMKEMFIKNKIRLINNNGEKHGTITARIEEKNFEVTTLRVDMATDGRHAEVQFTKNWFQDANRRDLTINAMFLDFEGCLLDYFNGYEDLKNRIVRFVGNSSQRIHEDYLRILRYFRFYGKIARDPDNHLEDTILAIKENAKGLENIAGERISVELYKILNGNFVYEILLKMIKLNVGQYIGFPETCNLVELKSVTDRLKNNQVTLKPISLLAAIFNTEEELDYFYARIKPSSYDKNLGYFIITYRDKLESSDPLKLVQKYIIMSQNKFIAKEYATELLKYGGKMESLKKLENWEIPKFPINGNHLRNKGVEGKKLGQVLDRLKEIWIDQDFKLDEEKLLENLPKITNNLQSSFHKKKS